MVNDLGGVSPVTDDRVNPGYAWPALRELEEIASEAGILLHERLPVYEPFPELVERDEKGRCARPPVIDVFDAGDDAGRQYRAVLMADIRGSVD